MEHSSWIHRLIPLPIAQKLFSLTVQKEQFLHPCLFPVHAGFLRDS